MPVERGAKKVLMLFLVFLALVSVKYAIGYLYETNVSEESTSMVTPPTLHLPETSPPLSETSPEEEEKEGKQAFFPDIEVYGEAPGFSNLVWINSAPLTLEDLRGRAVLVYFWTWTCERCIKSIPTLNELQAGYGEQGLVVIGFHGPSLPTDKSGEKVREVMKEHGIDYLVALDNDYKNWNNYGVSFTPTRFLIDKEGRIRYIAIGDWGFDETEESLINLLNE